MLQLLTWITYETATNTGAIGELTVLPISYLTRESLKKREKGQWQWETHCCIKYRCCTERGYMFGLAKGYAKATKQENNFCCGQNQHFLFLFSIDKHMSRTQLILYLYIWGKHVDLESPYYDTSLMFWMFPHCFGNAAWAKNIQMSDLVTFQ